MNIIPNIEKRTVYVMDMFTEIQSIGISNLVCNGPDSKGEILQISILYFKFSIDNENMYILLTTEQINKIQIERDYSVVRVFRGGGGGIQMT